MAKVTVKALLLNIQSGLATILASALPGDNVYVTGGVQLDLSPGAIKDPSSVGITGPATVSTVTPGVFSESLGGWHAEIVPATGGLSTYKLQFWNGTTEHAAGAYAAAITGGNLVLSIPYNVE